MPFIEQTHLFASEVASDFTAGGLYFKTVHLVMLGKESFSCNKVNFLQNFRIVFISERKYQQDISFFLSCLFYSNERRICVFQKFDNEVFLS